MTEISSKPLVMVIDDDDPTRMMATEFLTQAGFEVIDFESGLLGLEQLVIRSPDVIVLDVEMPEIDGFQVCRRIREQPGFDSTPILMLTGLNNSDSIDLAFEAGATDFATKPINWSLLCHRLRYMLRAWQSAQDLVYNQRSLASAQRIAQLGNWQLSPGKQTMHWSDQLKVILGSTSNVGTNLNVGTNSLDEFLACIYPDERATVAQCIANALSTPMDVPEMEFRLSTSSDSVRRVRQQLEQVLDTDGVVVSLNGVVQDYTEKWQTEYRIKQLAFYDNVTSLPNRALFQERVDEAIEQAKRDYCSVAVLYVDIDDFKLVNDTLGHASGDIMLNEIAARILTCVDETSATVARLGADEFTILLPSIEGDGPTIHAANQIIEKLSKPYSLNGGEIFSSSSIGIALYPDHCDDAGSLLKNADVAMSKAKGLGKNLFRMHDNSMDEEAQKRFRVESQLRGGLERNEFQVFYQPQIDLETGKLYSAEALIRWISPELGFVSPVDFIHIAEENGFIVPLGEWVLRTSCLQAVEWIESGFPISQVAVNISVLQFIRPDFTETVQQILNETGLDPNCLELEITESLLASDTELAVDTLRKLKAIGVQLSIDDFGTGYSSLSQLKHFPIDRLKLDQSFVQGVTTCAEDAAITRAVIAMTNSMNVKLLAEGVETEEQLEFLKNCNCNEVQGYFIGKPMPSDILATEVKDVCARLGALFDSKGNLRLAA